MEEDIRNNLIKAGRISAEALEYGKTLIKKKASLLDVTEKVENRILELGGKPAFPVQVSCDHIAAHFCPEQDDGTIFENQVVSLDLGVHVGGCIGDNAYTIDLSGRYSDLVKAAQKALDEALKITQVGTTLGEIGTAIQETISSYGFAPVKNLSGHGLGIYDVHTKPTIPNFNNNDKTKIHNGMVFAIEPFATTGAGVVQEAGIPTVFSFLQKRPVRSAITREVLVEIAKYEGLPFCSRWLVKKFGAKANFALRDLMQYEIIRSYPPLVEVNKGIVSQAEHSILVDEDKVIVLTRL